MGKRLYIALLMLLMAAPGMWAADLIVKGKVLCGKKGVQGVWVTDGEHFAQTDKKGTYSLEADTRHPFVYLSVPAGYDAPSEDGVAKYYLPMPQSEKESKNVNFTLEKRTANDFNQVVIATADPMIVTQADINAFRTAAKDISQTAKYIGKGKTVHGVCCGNMTASRYDMVPKYLTALQTSDVPFRHAVGTYDLSGGARTAESAADNFRRSFGPTYFSYDVGQVHYVFLDDNFMVGRDRNHIAYLPENQLAWLEQDLSHISPNSLVFVIMHIPAYCREGDQAEFSYANAGTFLTNADALLKILKPFDTHILSGHTRTQFNTQISRKLHVHSIAALGGNYWQDPLCDDGTPAGYGIFEIKGNKIENYRYKATGEEEDVQMKLYSGLDAREYEGYIVANIWNYADDWGVRFLVDGKELDVERFEGFDVAAAEAHASSSEERLYTGTPASEHFFRAQLPAGARTVMVVATDGAGETYTARATTAKQKQNYMWIDSQANFARMSNPDSIRFYLRQCKDAGFQNVVVDVKNIMGETLYDSQIAPYMAEYEGVTRDRSYDMLGQFIEAGHAIGLKVFASMNVFSGGHNYLDRGIIFSEHPEWQSTVYTASGFKPIGQVKSNYNGMLNPVDPAVQEYELSIIKELVGKYPALDGLVFDRVRFDGISSDFSDLSRAAFEKFIGRKVRRFPQDIIEWVVGPDGLYTTRRGNDFKYWIEWRSMVIRDFVVRAREAVKAINPNLPVVNYTGSWYPSSFNEGANWAAQTYDPSTYFDWASPSYKYTGMADQFDMLMCGLYYRTVARSEVETGLQQLMYGQQTFIEGLYTPADRRFVEDYWYCVEGAAQWVKLITDGAVPVVGGIQVSNYGADISRLPAAVRMARNNTDGLMVYDISQVISQQCWNSFAEALK